MQLSTEEFQEFRDYLQKVAGIDLAANKQYLVTTRIRRILLDYEIQSLSLLTQAIKQASHRELRQKVVDAMTTNETFWFRDLYPFEYLSKTILPELLSNSGQRIRLWSAACSSGQEPYSISMVVEEYIRSNFSVKSVPLEIVGTDLSSEILERAKQGIYDRLSIGRGLSDKRLKEFFSERESDVWQVKPQLRQRVTFQPLNLLDSFLLLGKFDIVFCRNVLIYFSSELKVDILRRIHGAMKPGAWLFLGSSESLAGASDLFDMIHCSPGVVYRAKK